MDKDSGADDASMPDGLNWGALVPTPIWLFVNGFWLSCALYVLLLCALGGVRMASKPLSQCLVLLAWHDVVAGWSAALERLRTIHGFSIYLEFPWQAVLGSRLRSGAIGDLQHTRVALSANGGLLR